jgi:hypothetical protein
VFAVVVGPVVIVVVVSGRELQRFGERRGRPNYTSGTKTCSQNSMTLRVEFETRWVGGFHPVPLQGGSNESAYTTAGTRLQTHIGCEQIGKLMTTEVSNDRRAVTDIEDLGKTTVSTDLFVARNHPR